MRKGLWLFLLCVTTRADTVMPAKLEEMCQIVEHSEAWSRRCDAIPSSQEESSIKMQNPFKQAERFSVDAGLEAWVEDQNVQKGIYSAPGLPL